MSDEEDYLEALVAVNTDTPGQLPYPLTVMAARYGGSYEGHSWVAFNCYPHMIPTAAYGDDVSCGGFWGYREDMQPKVGRGATPNQAIFDLIARLKIHGPDR